MHNLQADTARQLLLQCRLPLPLPLFLWQVMRGMQSPKIMSKKILLLTVRPKRRQGTVAHISKLTVRPEQAERIMREEEGRLYRKSNSLPKFLGLKRWQHVISLLSCRMTHTLPIPHTPHPHPPHPLTKKDSQISHFTTEICFLPYPRPYPHPHPYPYL